MEADWEVEIGADAAVIDSTWSGLVDLERNPSRIAEISEAANFPPLADTLLLLNAPAFHNVPSRAQGKMQEGVRTIKCDLWPVTDLDPDEMEATPATSLFGIAAYIDLLPRETHVFPDLAAAERWARQVVLELRSIPAHAARVDLVIRRAVSSSHEGLGITAYITGCGATSTAAYASFGRALQLFAETLAASTISGSVNPWPPIRKTIQ